MLPRICRAKYDMAGMVVQEVVASNCSLSCCFDLLSLRLIIVDLLIGIMIW
jgi:hypothetical protein